MRKQTFYLLVILFLALFALTGIASAQDKTVKLIGWDSFVRGLEYVKRPDGFAEWRHNSEELDNYMVIEVPARMLTVRHMYEVTSSGDAVMYLVVLNPDLSISGRKVGIRAMFYCNAPIPECPELLSRILGGRFSMQAIGKAERNDTDSEHTTLEFYINSTGKFEF